jgi:hypothetical protein
LKGPSLQGVVGRVGRGNLAVLGSLGREVVLVLGEVSLALN